MRRSRRHPMEIENAGFNMTPLIDITFQLLVFFMVATSMGSAQVEELTLPKASLADIDEDPESLIVNITDSGMIKVAGREYSEDALIRLFESKVAKAERGMGYPVLVRADRSTPFEHVQKVVTIASARGAITRVHFGAKKE